jgi:methylphosphotriester-DNA--protein-cysteine methyltransferase
MIHHINISKAALHKGIRQNNICFGGNRKLKIYGTLHCKSGKRMKKENRVFFSSIKEAVAMGYRPCGHCMQAAYKKYPLAQVFCRRQLACDKESKRFLTAAKSNPKKVKSSKLNISCLDSVKSTDCKMLVIFTREK